MKGVFTVFSHRTLNVKLKGIKNATNKHVKQPLSTRGRRKKSKNANNWKFGVPCGESCFT